MADMCETCPEGNKCQGVQREKCEKSIKRMRSICVNVNKEDLKAAYGLTPSSWHRPRSHA